MSKKIEIFFFVWSQRAGVGYVAAVRRHVLRAMLAVTQRFCIFVCMQEISDNPWLMACVSSHNNPLISCMADHETHSSVEEGAAAITSAAEDIVIAEENTNYMNTETTAISIEEGTVWIQ